MTTNKNAIVGPDWRKGPPQVMVKSAWADAKPGDYFESYPDSGTFVSFTPAAPKEGTMGSVIFTDRYGKTTENPYASMTLDRVFIRRPITKGMLATASFNGDSYPCEVKGWSPSGHQVHVLWGDKGDNRPLRTYTRRKDGRYFEKGSHSGFSLMFGVAESKMNPEF